MKRRSPLAGSATVGLMKLKRLWLIVSPGYGKTWGKVIPPSTEANVTPCVYVVYITLGLVWLIFGKPPSPPVTAVHTGSPVYNSLPLSWLPPSTIWGFVGCKEIP